MQITKANNTSRGEIIALLESQKLPAGDLPATLDDFYTALDEGKIVGLAGMERHGDHALLRSVVVDPSFRNRQIAGTLVEKLEGEATRQGIQTMYLLTETAEKYFSRKGYETITRQEVPEDVRQSTEFSHVCPASAAVMKKALK